MSRASVLARARVFAAAAFTDSCRVERPGPKDSNPISGEVTTQYIPVYQGPCRVQTAGGPAGQVQVAEAVPRQSSATLQLPVSGSEGIRPGDRVTILACAGDVELVGRIYHVTGEHHASEKSSRRLAMDEVI